MGRIAYKNTNLPPRLRARPRAHGVIYYYYDFGGRPRKERALGSNYIAAIREWGKLEQSRFSMVVVTFDAAANAFLTGALLEKAPRTQQDYIKDLRQLREFFKEAPLAEIKPLHIRQYMKWRSDKSKAWLKENKRKATADSGKVRANREIALFSVIFNYARETGLTDLPNPCLGVSRFAEEGRDTYVDDSMYKLVYSFADQPLRDAMDLAYLTGQRPADTAAMTDHDIHDGYLHIKQGKTKAKLRIAVEGELKALIERIRSRRNAFKVVCTYLVVNRYGRAVQSRAVAEWLKDTRRAAGVPDNDFQFRDLRAKAGTDKEDSSGMAAAKDQLGHTNEKMTAHYVRHRLGKKVSPTR